MEAIHFDLSPKRKEAYSPYLAGKGLGVRSVFHVIENRYIYFVNRTGCLTYNNNVISL
jgi:hypothetical protein